MAQNLLEGFRLENCDVEPALGVIDGPGGSTVLGSKAMEILVCLAQRADRVVSRSTIVNQVWGDDTDGEALIDNCLEELDAALRNASNGTAYVQDDQGNSWCLVGKIALHKTENDGFSIRNLWTELKARDVVRVSIAYWAIVWAALQSADFLFGLIPGVPGWATKFMVVLAIIGFPLVVAFSWIFRWTPYGIALDESKAPARVASNRRLEIVIAAAAAIAVALFFFEPGDGPIVDPDGDGGPTSIAVLRFVNIGNDPENDFYTDGISDELLNLLANIGELRVPARESSWSLFGKGLDAPAIADRLKVEHVIEGSVRRVGDRIRVMIQLIDAEGNHIWSKPFERDRNAILDLPSNIAAEIVDELQVVMSLKSAEYLRKLPTENDEAYIFFLQAKDYLDRPRQTDTLDLAKGLFEKALAADSRFAMAHAGLCETHLAKYRRGSSQDEFEAAEAACHRAATLDANIVSVYVALGNLYRSSGQYEKAEDEFRRAIELKPMLEAAHYGLARSLQGQGRLEETEEILRYCVELEPAYWGTYLALGNFLHQMGRYEEATVPYERVTELTPETPDGYSNLGAAYYDAGQWEKAGVAYRKSVELDATEYGYQNLGTLFYYQGQYDDALAMHQESVAINPESYRGWGKVASAARYIPGSEETSLSAYSRAIELAEAVVEINPEDAVAQAYLASYYVNVDKDDLATAAISAALEAEPENPEVHYLHAIVSIRQGDRDKCLAALKEAVNRGYSLRLIGADPQFEPLRSESEFRNLLASR